MLKYLEKKVKDMNYTKAKKMMKQNDIFQRNEKKHRKQKTMK